MRKNYFLLVLLVLFMATQAKAQVASIADLFGDYKFTADVEYTAEGEAYKNLLLKECDATISEGTTYMAKIVGFAGSQTQQNINAISIEKEQVKVTNPNNPQLFNGLYLANVDGDNPNGVFENGEWVVESIPAWYYTYNPTTKEISIPDFTIISLADARTDLKGTILAKYTNVKMTLVKSAEIEVADLEGDWNFAAGKSTYSTMAGSVIPAEFAINLAKTGDDNRNYNATIAIEGYEAMTLPATFDGQMLNLAYDNTYLDEANGIRVAPMYGATTSGVISFKSGSSNDVLSLYSGFSFASDSLGKAKDEVTDSLIVNAKYHQWYMDGSMRRKAEAPEFNWDGTWNITGEFEAYDEVAIDLSNSFEMTVEYNEAGGMYLVTNFMGCDLVNLNNGGLLLTPAEDGKSATIALMGSSYPALLCSLGEGFYLQLVDENATAGAITLTLKEDGTFDAGSFFISKYNFASNESEPIVAYEEVVAEKVVEEVAPAFELAGDYVLTANTDVYYQGEDVEFPTEFNFTIQYFDLSAYGMDSYYGVTKFMGRDIAYSPIKVNVVEEGKEYELEAGGLCGTIVAGELYYKLYDMNATTSPIKITVNEDGTLSIANFFIKVNDYIAGTEYAGATYKNVVVAKPGEPEAPAFELAGDYAFAANTDVYYQGEGVEFPTEFDVKIQYFDGSAYGMDSYYYISTFMGRELGQSVIKVNVVEEGKEYELEAGGLCGAIVAGELYYKLYDMNATTSPIKMTVNEDGTLSIATFFIKVYDYTAGTESAGATYKNAVLTSGTTGIENVVADGIAVEGIFDIQGRRIDEISAPGLYIINGKKVLVK